MSDPLAQNPTQNSADAVPQVVDTNATAPAVDAAASPVLETTTALQQALELAEKGGPVMAVLGVLSVLVVTFIVAKTLHLVFTSRPLGGTAGRLLNAVSSHDASAQRTLLNQSASNHALLALYKQALALSPEAAKSAQADTIRTSAEAIVGEWRSGLRFLDLTSQLAPLLGLLGTILGMIAAFQVLETADGQADPALLAGGIWVALLTTAAGLVVAMIAYLGHGFLESRVEQRTRQLEGALTTLIAAQKPEAEEVQAPALASQPTKLKPVA